MKRIVVTAASTKEKINLLKTQNVKDLCVYLAVIGLQKQRLKNWRGKVKKYNSIRIDPETEAFLKERKAVSKFKANCKTIEAREYQEKWNLEEFTMANAFDWAKTPEGRVFWGDLYKTFVSIPAVKVVYNPAVNSNKQERYQDGRGDDLIDRWAKNRTHEQFRDIMFAMVEKYDVRLGKKDSILSEVTKMTDYMNRWLEYEKIWDKEEECSS